MRALRSTTPLLRWALCAALVLAAPACGGDGGTGTPNPTNPAPTVASLSPTGVARGSGAFTLTVNGTKFVSGAVVRWNGADRPTTFVSATQLTAAIGAADVAQGGTVHVTVFNPAPGGGASGVVELQVNFPPPSVTGISPAGVLQGSGAFTLTVNGADFASGAVVRWNGADRLTTFVSAAQLTAQISAADADQAGAAQVTVFNPAPGGGASNAMALTVSVHPRPAIGGLNPSQIVRGSGPVTLFVSGMGFVNGSVVRWNGADRPTTFVSATQLAATIQIPDLVQAGVAEVTVFNPAPGGGASIAASLAVTNPVPVATLLTPGTVVAEVGGTLTLAGAGFVPESQVSVGGFKPTVTVVSANELRFTLGPQNVPNAGTAPVLVTNPGPGGGNSGVVTLVVNNPAPTVSAVSPAETVVGQQSLAVRLTGTGFVNSTVVRVNGNPRPTRRISPTEVEATLGDADLVATGTRSLRAFNPQPGGGESAPVQLSLVNPVPVVTAITPSQAEAAQDSLVVRLTGSGFLGNTVVRVDGAERTTRRLSATQLEAVLTADDLDDAGTRSITATNPAPGGGTSAATALTLAAPVPVITTLPANGASAGRAGFPLVVHGTGFTRSSVVRWNGQARPTSYISNTRLEIAVTAGDVAAPGTATVTVHTPGGGTSGGETVTIRSVGSFSLADTRTVALPARDLAYDAARDRIYASLASTAGAEGNTVVAIDPHTGAVTASVGVGSDPGALALSDDGTTLWVAVDGSSQVRRLGLPGLTPGTAFSLGFGEAAEMEVMPGRAGTLAVAREGLVEIYDNGVRRSQVGGSNTMAFGESASVLYGYNNYSSEFGLRTFRVGADGVTEVRLGYGLIEGYYQRIRHAGGRVYGYAGTVADPGRNVRVGTFSPGPNRSAMVVDPALGRAYFVSTLYGELSVYDVNTFQQLGSVSVGGLTFNHPANARDKLIRWGADGLAYTDGQNIYLWRSALAGP